MTVEQFAAILADARAHMVDGTPPRYSALDYGRATGIWLVREYDADLDTMDDAMQQAVQEGREEFLVLQAAAEAATRDYPWPT